MASSHVTQRFQLDSETIKSSPKQNDNLPYSCSSRLSLIGGLAEGKYVIDGESN